MARRKYPEKPIRTLDDLPEAGLVFWTDFLSTPDDVRLVPFGQSTWRRQVATGEAPPVYKWFGRLCARVEHVRAVVLGQDWRTAELPKGTTL